MVKDMESDKMREEMELKDAMIQSSKETIAKQEKQNNSLQSLALFFVFNVKT